MLLWPLRQAPAPLFLAKFSQLQPVLWIHIKVGIRGSITGLFLRIEKLQLLAFLKVCFIGWFCFRVTLGEFSATTVGHLRFVATVGRMYTLPLRIVRTTTCMLFSYCEATCLRFGTYNSLHVPSTIIQKGRTCPPPTYRPQVFLLPRSTFIARICFPLLQTTCVSH